MESRHKNQDKITLSYDLNQAEKQLISCVAWFRTRYALFLGLDLNRKANIENIEAFGDAWMGKFKSDWTMAFTTLLEKGILVNNESEYDFTANGEVIKNELNANTPFFKYEYDLYFDLDRKSKVHSQFCEEVYGLDLSQHGLIDQQELSHLMQHMKANNFDNILDVGCGNGRITEYLAKQLHGQFVGLDISSEGIRLANERNLEAGLSFVEGNMNQLTFLSRKFDAILFLDTIYYADSIAKVLEDSLELLNQDGQLLMYFSAFIMNASESENLKGNQTSLAKIVKALGLQFECIDLTASGLAHWKKKLSTLEAMKARFYNEGEGDLWTYRYREAYRYAHWGDDKYARYFYSIHR